MKKRAVPRAASVLTKTVSGIGDPKYILGVILLTAIIYNKLWNADFVFYDDDVLVFNNENIKRIDIDLITSSFGFERITHYHPLVTLSFAIEYAFFGLNPSFFHLTNILLHCLNSLLVLFVLVNLNIDKKVSFLIFIVFALHPIHVESVAWITERKDMLYSVFFLAALLAYILYMKKKNAKLFLASIVLLVMSCLSKSMAITFPLLLVLCDYFLTGKLRVNLRRLLPFIFVALVFLIINVDVAYYNLDAQKLAGTELFFLICYSIVFYPWKILLPMGLSSIYTYPAQLDLIHYISPILLLGSLLIVYASRNRILIFGMFWYLMTIIPVLPLLPFGISLTADRFVYIPSIGIFVMIIYPVSKLNSYISKKVHFLKYALAVFFICALVSISLISYSRCDKWEDTVTLMHDALDYDSRNHYAYLILGNYYTAMGSFDSAIVNYQKSVQIKQDYKDGLFNLGNAYFYKGDYEESAVYFKKLLIVHPADMEALNNLGVVYENLGDIPKAIECFERSAAMGYMPSLKALEYYDEQRKKMH